ncbi:hypothetical protein LUZ60_010185 [Juncus effusus]|nr:hypothetical protein LUZ60_010185 [Juncus effusus]
MAVTDETRIFVGGLAYETSDRTLESAFGRFGEILEAQVIKERDTGRPRGFGFVTYSDPIAVDNAISEMNNVELDGRIISVNRAEARPGSADGYGSRSGGGRTGGYRDDVSRGPPAVRDRDECYKCGRSGHWARDCPSMNGTGGGGGRGSRYSPPAPPRYGSGGRGRGGGRGGGGRYGGGGERYGGGGGGGGERHGGSYYVDDRYDGGRYGDRDRIDPRDRYIPDRYAPAPPVADRYPIDRYAEDRYHVERYPQNGYGKERVYEREPVRGGHGHGGYYRDAPRGYERDVPVRGGNPRYENGGGYRGRPGPYDRPSRGGRHFDERY